MKKFPSFYWLLLALSPFSAAADQEPNVNLNNTSDRSYSLIIGLIAIEATSEFKEGEQAENLAPIINWHWKNWFLTEYRFGSYLAGNDSLYLSSSIGAASFGSSSRGNSPALDDMKKLEDPLTFGIALDMNGLWGAIELSIEQDINQGHNGNIISLAYQYDWQLADWELEPFINFLYLSDSLVNEYYGVSDTEISENRPAFKTQSAQVMEAGLSITYSPIHSHLLVFSLGHQQLSNNITDSPIVDQSTTKSLGVGYLYEF